MEVVFEKKALGIDGVSKAQREARLTLLRFFKGLPISQVLVGPIRDLTSNGRSQQPVRLAKAYKPKVNESGVPIVVHTYGKQGATVLITVKDENGSVVTEDTLRDMIEHPNGWKISLANAPASPPVEAVSLPTMTLPFIEPPAPVVEVSPLIVEEEMTKASVPIEKPRRKSSMIGFTPLMKLQNRDVSLSEIERLKATLSSIVDAELRRTGEKSVSNTLQVSVDTITECIMEHMQLPANARGHYQGTIANFYVTRIALFGEKANEARDEEARYDDWFLDCSLILDFVGGKNKLFALAKERKAEVAKAVEERAKRSSLPVTVEKLQTAFDTEVSYRTILDEAEKLSQARSIEEQALEMARENVRLQENMVAELERSVTEARHSLEKATGHQKEVEARLAALTLSPELAAQLRSVRSRILALTEDFGL